MTVTPNQPDRCPSIDPHATLQCGRRVHDDDQCQFGGIAWKKGAPRHLTDAEILDRIRALAAEHAGCSGCPTPGWLTVALKGKG